MGGALRSPLPKPGVNHELVIDFHYHLFAEDLIPEPFHRMLAGFVRAMARARGGDITDEEVRGRVLPSMWDRDGTKAQRALDEDGVELAVLLPVDHGARMGDASTSIWDYNELVASMAQQEPARFVAFCAVEPHRHDALDLVTTAVQRWGAKGLKLVPNRDFSVDDDCVMPLLAKMTDWGLPVLVHTGKYRGEGGRSFCHPSHLERMLREFPSLTVVAAHVSGQWWRELNALAERYANLTCDISMLQPGMLENRGRCCYVLRRVMDAFGPSRVLFASDGPTTDLCMTRAEWVRTIARLPSEAPEGIDFTEAEVRAVLFDNAARVLGLSC